MKCNRTALFSVSLVIFLSCFIVNCKSFKEQEDQLPDTKYRGIINVSADESFRPVIDEQVQVYESNFPGAKINVTYKPEAECLKDLFIDSVRMVIVTRRYNEYEKEFIADSFKTALESMVIARDGIALIVNPAAPDSLFTRQDVKNILAGDFKKNLIPVFDGVKATSTVRFIIDSVLRGDSLTTKAVAASSHKSVRIWINCV